MTLSVVTVFGGTGFIGRHVVRRLAQMGLAIRVPTRDQASVLPLRPMGEVGQIVGLDWDPADPSRFDSLIDGSDAVVNLIGILAERSEGDFQRLQAELPGEIAKTSKRLNVRRFVQMSAIGAALDSPSEYAKTKAEGEERVREQLPWAPVVRPSIVFGPGDGFFELFAGMARFAPALPLIAGGTTKFQPVYVDNVAESVVRLLKGEGAEGATYELGGPSVYSFKELLRYILKVTNRRRFLVPLPMSIARMQARLAELLPEPPLTRDQLLLLERDNVVSEDAKTLADLGIQATPIELIVPHYLKPYAVRSIKLPIA